MAAAERNRSIRMASPQKNRSTTTPTNTGRPEDGVPIVRVPAGAVSSETRMRSRLGIPAAACRWRTHEANALTRFCEVGIASLLVPHVAITWITGTGEALYTPNAFVEAYSPDASTLQPCGTGASRVTASDRISCG